MKIEVYSDCPYLDDFLRDANLWETSFPQLRGRWIGQHLLDCSSCQLAFGSASLLSLFQNFPSSPLPPASASPVLSGRFVNAPTVVPSDQLCCSLSDVSVEIQVLDRLIRRVLESSKAVRGNPAPAHPPSPTPSTFSPPGARRHSPLKGPLPPASSRL